jgi:hypothetical protein
VGERLCHQFPSLPVDETDRLRQAAGAKYHFGTRRPMSRHNCILSRQNLMDILRPDNTDGWTAKEVRLVNVAEVLPSASVEFAALRVRIR